MEMLSKDLEFLKGQNKMKLNIQLFATDTMSTLTAENQTFYDRCLLERCTPELTFYEDAQKKKIPAGKGTKIEWRKFNSLTPATTPLTEGTTPSGSNLNITKVEATLDQYGDYVTVSDVLEMQAKDPIITETSQLEGEQAGETLNNVIGDVISKGTTVRYAGSATSTGALTNTDVLTGALIKKAVRDLARNNIKRFPDGYYHATISPEQAYDLMNDTSTGGWIDANKYSNAMPLLKGELGCYAGVRFKESSVTPKGEGAKIGSTENKYVVHKALIYGKNTYGVPEIGEGGGKPKIIVKQKGSAGTNDPLDQRGTIGWKAMFAAKRLNELGIVRIETGVSD